MFYIVEHDMKVHQIIDTKGKANKYGKAKLFDTEGDALYWLSKHKMGSAYGQLYQDTRIMRCWKQRRKS